MCCSIHVSSKCSTLMFPLNQFTFSSFLWWKWRSFDLSIMFFLHLVSAEISPPGALRNVGSSATFTCRYRSSSFVQPTSYQWSRADGLSLPDRSQQFNSDDGAGLLVILNLQLSDSGVYRCEVQTTGGNAISDAQLRVISPTGEAAVPLWSVKASLRARS